MYSRRTRRKWGSLKMSSLSRHSLRTVLTHRSAIGSTQITKFGKFPTRGGGDNVPDLELVVGDDNAVNEEFDELPLLVKGSVLKTCLNALTEILQMVNARA